MDFMKDIVDIQITNVTGNTNTTDLNTILIMAKHDKLKAPEMFAVYTELTELAEAKFEKTSYVYKSAQLAFSQTRRPKQIVVSKGVEVDGSYVEMFDKMQMINQGWLWLVSDLRDPVKQLELAKAVQATEKFYAIGTSDANAVVSTNKTDIGSLIQSNQLSQSYAWFDVADTDLKTYSATEIALLARCGGDVAGTVQFLLKELIGVPSPDSIVDTKTKQNALTDKGYTFCAVGNKKVYSFGAGKLGNGEWIDIGLATTWIKVNIRERIFNTLTSVDTLPMENDGASVIEGDVRSVLMEARDLGIIANDSPIVVTVPDVTQLSKVTRSKRNLPRVRFSCRLRGAIIGTEVRGEVYE